MNVLGVAHTTTGPRDIHITSLLFNHGMIEIEPMQNSVPSGASTFADDIGAGFTIMRIKRGIVVTVKGNVQDFTIINKGTLDAVS